MASIGDLVGELKQVITTTVTARTDLDNAERAWDEAACQFSVTLAGSTEDSNMTTLAGTTHDGFVRTRQLLETACEAVRAIVIRLRSDNPAKLPDSMQTPPQISVKSPAGDTYPPQADWAAQLIDRPYSPAKSRVPVVGIARAVGRTGTFEIRPGGGHWTETADNRLDELNAAEWARKVSYHVEMQVAAWMVSTGTKHAELVINREPCGEQIGRGCHQALRTFLPEGYRLSIFGTRGAGRYYCYDYEGRARS